MTRWARPRQENAWAKKGKKKRAETMESLKSLYAASPKQEHPDQPELPCDPMKHPLGESVPPENQKKKRGRPKGSGKPKDPLKAKKTPPAPKIGSDGQILLTERDEQRIVVVYCTTRGLPFYAIPNGARRSYWEAREAKLSGMKAGVPDLCFPAARNGFHGMFIEMKRREGGTVSETQKNWLEVLIANGYKAVVALGAKEALKHIDEYFGIT